MKKNKALSYGAFIIGSAIIWGAVIIGAALILKGTPYKDSITKLLFGGVILHLILIWVRSGHWSERQKKKRVPLNNFSNRYFNFIEYYLKY